MQTGRWLPIGSSLAALVLALFFGGILIALVGGDPIATYAHIANVAFGSLGGITDTLTKATPLILVGLACSLAFRMKLWNIGAEGQFYMGAWAASAVVLIPLLPPRNFAHHFHSGDDDRGHVRRRGLGLYSGLPESALQSQ